MLNWLAFGTGHDETFVIVLYIKQIPARIDWFYSTGKI